VWHLLTGEAPGAGGIGDYTSVVAEGLGAAGEEARIWAARSPRALDAALADFPAPRRLLFQYAPQAWGARGMNLPACHWLLRRRAAGDEVRVMFHEPFFPFGRQPLRRNLLALVNRRMARVLLAASSRAYVSTAAWEPLLRPLAPHGLRIETLPIPSTIPFVPDPPAVRALHVRLSSDGARRVVAHFGTYGALVAPGLLDVIRAMPHGGVRFLLLGRGGAEFARRLPPGVDAVAPGELGADQVSLHLQAADVAIQPYPDGVDTRRTTVMACLANGLPIVTTRGRLTDAVWEEGPVALAGSVGEMVGEVERLLGAGIDREAVRAFYRDRFAVERTVERLLG
jgi:glycosyltransferase involved in cell wall biosynthesis